MSQPLPPVFMAGNPPVETCKRSLRPILWLLPLLCFAPLGYFLGFYFDGSGTLQHGNGITLGVISMLVLPWVVAAVFSALPKLDWKTRIACFISVLVVHFFLFSFIPAGATSEMMGIAHRLRREFPPDQIRACADGLLRRFHDGKLATSKKSWDHSYMQFVLSEDVVVVANSELPESLRGRFHGVFIQQDRGNGGDEVWFTLGERTGIVCDTRKHVWDFWVCSMAEGVHAYRYQRL